MFEDEPIRSTKPVPLDMLSIDELEARIAALKDEIARCEAMIDSKKGHKSAADSVFGRKSS
jgi:uncharacterized small protein (DUF1192 family)